MAIFRAKKNTYMNLEERCTFSVWHPQIRLNGEWCYLPDESTKTKLVESEDEETATELAITALRNVRKQLEAQHGKTPS